MRISDWSSDVCSSDLGVAQFALRRAGMRQPETRTKTRRHKGKRGCEAPSQDSLFHGTVLRVGESGLCKMARTRQARARPKSSCEMGAGIAANPHYPALSPCLRSASSRPASLARSEERRVGKECVRTCRPRWPTYQDKKNT